MLIGGNKEKVIANMRDAAERGDLNCKVETDDPVLSQEEREKIIRKYLDKYRTFGYRFCNVCARALTDTATRWLNRDTRIEGLENIKEIHDGAIVTSNHFSPLDNTAVREAMNKAGYRRLFIVSQETNLAMKGWIGFLMNHEDIIPLVNHSEYLRKYFDPMIRERLRHGDAVLIYPEQEMWFHYRKPRPPKRGAYYYAAVNHVPVISCFVEIRDLQDKENEEFHKTRYVMHILEPIYPDPAKNARENSREMMRQDYRQKVAAYEQAYGETLTYDFRTEDIAGWIPPEDRERVSV
ncbi:MAG: 1-acyl-sn-glycerol-3-phosphate acyltransferase [Lachnospiraceae bacterium]|nr:1-acyl-sn-glycerol-3-phosphate acyltransferase [Lachnospiraceae bacterium]